MTNIIITTNIKMIVIIHLRIFEDIKGQTLEISKLYNLRNIDLV